MKLGLFGEIIEIQKWQFYVQSLERFTHQNVVLEEVEKTWTCDLLEKGCGESVFFSSLSFNPKLCQ